MPPKTNFLVNTNLSLAKYLIIVLLTWTNLVAFSQTATDNPPPQGAPGNTMSGIGCINIASTAANTPTPNFNPNCAAYNSSGGGTDMFLWITVPATGTTFFNPSGTVDAAMAVWQPTGGGNYTLLDCDDDTGPGLMPQISLSGLTPGTLLLVQLWPYSDGADISFQFCYTDCDPNQQFFLDADGDGFGDAGTTSCSSQPGYVANSNDCNDNCDELYLGAPCNDGNPNTYGDAITATCTCVGSPPSACTPLANQSFTFNGAASLGSPAVGTNVNICYSIDYVQASGDWLDGLPITLGSGWGNPTPVTAPATCGFTGGTWVWQSTNNPSGGNATPTGYGYYYDTNGDGNGGNDWGDPGSCTFTMCFSAQVQSTTGLTVSVAPAGDSYYGSYGSTATTCPPVGFNYPSNNTNSCVLDLPFCVTPSTCDMNTGNYTIDVANMNQIHVFNAPATGQLVVMIDGTPVGIPFNAPFSPTLNLNITQLADGAPHTMTAMFTSLPGCTDTENYVSPIACGCEINVTNVTTTCTGNGLYDVAFDLDVNAPPSSGTLTVTNACTLAQQTFALPDATIENNTYTFSNLSINAPAGLTPAGCTFDAVFSTNAGCTIDVPVSFFPPVSIIEILDNGVGNCVPSPTGDTHSIEVLVTALNAPATGNLQLIVDGVSDPANLVALPSGPNEPYTLSNIPSDGLPHTISATFTDNDCIVLNPNAAIPGAPTTYTAPVACPCNVTINSITPTACLGYINTYDVAVDIALTNIPSGQSLEIYLDGAASPETTINNPGASVSYTISGLTADGLAHNISASFTGYTAANPCEDLMNYNAPTACDCQADAGTFTPAAANSIVLCSGQSVILNSNDNFVLPPTISGQAPSFGIGLAVYSAPPTVFNDQIQSDPAYLGVLTSMPAVIPLANLTITNDPVSSAALAALIGVTFDAPITFYVAPVTIYNTTTNPVTLTVDALPADPTTGFCGDVGDVYEITLVPPITVDATPYASCMGGTVTVQVSEGNPAVNLFDWNVSGIAPASVTTFLDPAATGFANGDSVQFQGLQEGDMLAATVTDPLGCTAQFNYGPFDGPLVGVVNLPNGVSANAICEFSNPFILVGNGPQPGTWTGPALPSGNVPIAADGTFTPSTELINNSPYPVSYTPGGCATGITFNITVQPTVVPIISAIPNYCLNSPMVNLAFYGGPAGGTWTGTGVTNNMFDPSAAGAGTFTLTYDVSAAAAVTCGVTNTGDITINTPSSATFTPSLTEGCEDLSVDFTNLTANAQNCIWKINGIDTNVGDCAGMTYLFTDPGCYDVTLVTTDNNICRDTLTLNDLVCVNALPIVNFVSNPQQATMDAPLFMFYDNSDGLVQYSWDFAGMGSSNIANPSYNFQVTEPGDYEVCLTGTDLNGCVNTYCNTVNIKDGFAIFTPSAITADDDNLNEAFRPMISGADQIRTYRLRVYDRWGNTVFDADDPEKYWNCDNNGDGYYVNEGVYHWLLEVRMNGLDEIKTFMGSVTVIR